MAPPERNVRNRTRSGRLAALDAWLLNEVPELLDGRGCVVDVGFGLTPVTTEELALAIPKVRVVGVDRHEAKSELVELRVGGFEVVEQLAPVAVVRAMNVLRGYREEEVEPARDAMCRGLIPNGLLIEGSTDTDGHVLVAHLRRGSSRQLLFHTDFARGFSPWLFRDWLPRELRRSAKPGTWIHDALTAWATRVNPELGDPRERFMHSAPLATEWEKTNGFARLRYGG
ncbi:MAG: hypothetical protein ACO1OB_27360 [Archangium sp.]